MTATVTTTESGRRWPNSTGWWRWQRALDGSERWGRRWSDPREVRATTAWFGRWGRRRHDSARWGWQPAGGGGGELWPMFVKKRRRSRGGGGRRQGGMWWRLQDLSATTTPGLQWRPDLDDGDLWPASDDEELHVGASESRGRNGKVKWERTREREWGEKRNGEGWAH